jgi:hypothetical protein
MPCRAQDEGRDCISLPGVSCGQCPERFEHDGRPAVIEGSDNITSTRPARMHRKEWVLVGWLAASLVVLMAIFGLLWGVWL